jgi:hydrogenase expression/formation protein HypD
VIAGLEPADLLEAIRMLVEQLESGVAKVENQYARSVTQSGNIPAQRMVEQVFEIADRKWRGIGVIPQSGLRLREEFAAHDAERIFPLTEVAAEEPAECISAQVLRGLKRPVDCTAFGGNCSPEHPLGAPMVSAEGACAAYFHYRRHSTASEESPCP